MQQRTIGDLILLFVTFCWGVTFPLIENAVKVVDPFVFVTARFFFATLLLIPFLYKNSHAILNKKILKAGIILGLLNVVSYGAQTKGLETISAGQSAFITGTCVVMVPFLLPLFRMGTPTGLDVISSFFCLIGLSLLTGSDIHAFNIGCSWTLLCALAAALTIIYLQKASEKQSSLNVLAFYQILFTSIFTSPFSLHKSYAPLFQHDALIALLFCAIFATSLSLLLQTRYQRFTTASRAAMIFCLEPLFASIFSYWINGETLGVLALMGGLFILFSLLMPEIYRIVQAKILSKEVL